jgi:hypothetical protein
MRLFCNNGWAYYEKVQEIMPSYARGTTLFCPAEGPPVSVNGRVDSGAIMIGGGGSREAGGGDGRDDVQGDEDDIMGSRDGVPIPPIPSSGSKCKLLTDDDITGVNPNTTQTPECTKDKYNVKIKVKGSLLRSHQQPT